MSAPRSADQPAALPTWLALPAGIVGWGAMLVAMPIAAPLGIRPALVIAELCLAAPSLVAFAAWRIPWSRGLALARPVPATWLLAVLTGAALWAGSLGLFELQYAAWPPPPGYLDSFQLLHRALRPSGVLDGVASVVAIALTPALCEEIVFRGTLLPSLQRWARPWGAVLISALLFGSIHVDPTTSGAYTLYRVPFAASVGLGLGLLRVRSGSLVPCVIAHATLNAITFFTVLLTAPSTELEAANLLQGSGLFLLGTGASVFLLRLHARPSGS